MRWNNERRRAAPAALLSSRRRPGGEGRVKTWPKAALGDLLVRADETAVLDPMAEYHEVTIRLWGKGIVSRGKVLGSDVVSARRVVRANQLILSLSLIHI